MTEFGILVTEKQDKKEKKLDHQQHQAKAAPGKKKQEKWSSRDTNKAYAHPWMLTSLKGHSGEVLDMDFSGNSKFLASCSDGKSSILLNITS